MASFAIIAGLNSLRRSMILVKWPRFLQAVFMVMMTSFLAGIATMPFIAYHFGHITFLGIIANVIAVPLTGLVIMPLGVLSLGLAPFGADIILLPALEGAIYLLNSWAGWLAKAPFAAVWIKSPPSNLLLAVCFIWLVGAVWDTAKVRTARYLKASIVSAAIVAVRPLPDAVLLRQYGQLVWVIPTFERAYISGRITPFWTGVIGQLTGPNIIRARSTVNCGPLCSFDIEGKQVWVLTHRRHLTPACRIGAADMVISPFEPIYYCHNPIHHFQLRPDERVMVYLRPAGEGEPFEIEVRSNLDGLPWRMWRP